MSYIKQNQIFNWNESWTNTQKLNSIKNFLTENPLVINYRIYEQIEIISEQILLNIGVYQQGYLTGIHYGKIEGESIGIRKGKDLGYQEAMDLRWIRAIFTAFSSFFAIKLFGDITVGVLVGVPIFITLALWLFRLVRGE